MSLLRWELIRPGSMFVHWFTGVVWECCKLGVAWECCSTLCFSSPGNVVAHKVIYVTRLLYLWERLLDGLGAGRAAAQRRLNLRKDLGYRICFHIPFTPGEFVAKGRCSICWCLQTDPGMPSQSYVYVGCPTIKANHQCKPKPLQRFSRTICSFFRGIRPTVPTDRPGQSGDLMAWRGDGFGDAEGALGARRERQLANEGGRPIRTRFYVKE